MKVFQRSLVAAVAAIVVISNVCSVNNQPLIGNLNTVSAESYSDEMKYGDFLSYENVDEDEDGKYDYIWISKCDKSAVSVEIPSEIEGVPVTYIGALAFRYCTELTSIEIPDSVTHIYEHAFSGCKNLTSVEIPDSVTYIGVGVFYGCIGLTSVEIPDSVTYIQSSVFSGCSGLTSAKIPDSTTSIGEYAFSSCSGLTSVEIPDSVTYIGAGAFKNCIGLTSITIKNPECKIDSYVSTMCNGYDENEKAYFSGTIYGYEDSTAQAYAEKYSYKFESLGKKPSVTTEPFLPGDTNLDGKIDLYDAIWIAEHMAGIRKLTPEQFEAADIDKKNGDGVVNLYDAIRIAEIMAEQRK